MNLEDLGNKLEDQVAAITQKVDSIMVKFDTAAAQMLEKAAKTVPDATALNQAKTALSLEVENLRSLIRRLCEWSQRPDCLTPDALRIWTEALTLVKQWDAEQNEGSTDG